MICDNPFPHTLDNKRYHTWNYYLKREFGGKVGKAALDGGFTCPNRDGTKGVGGCVYCSPRGSGDFAGDRERTIKEQYLAQRAMLAQKWPDVRCIAYFQAFSGTYAPVERLRDLYEQALNCPGVVGLCIATRADLLPGEVLDLLGELNRRCWLMVELGLQTVHDRTARAINRCHSFLEFLDGYQKLREAGIRTCLHIINYLPGETEEMMLATAQAVGNLRPHSVKIHMLHLLRGTALGELHDREPLRMPDMDTYIRLVCDQLERIPPEVVIQRLTGDPPREDLLAPEWTLRKRQVLNGIDRELVRRASWQGKALATQ